MKFLEQSNEVQKGRPVFYRTWLPDKKLSAMLIIIHGLGEHSLRYGTHFADFFTQENIGLKAFDLPGHGASFGKRGHIDQPTLLLEIIDRLILDSKTEFPDLPLFIYGHSLGGEIGLWYLLARKPKINGAIITGPSIQPKISPPGWKLVLAKFMDRFLPSFTMNNDLDPKDLSHDENIVSQYISDPLVHPLISAKTGMMLINRGGWIMENAAENTNPILLMAGEKDNIISVEAAEKFSRLAPLVTYKAWPDLFHEIHNEPEKQEVFNFTLQWIKVH